MFAPSDPAIRLGERGCLADCLAGERQVERQVELLMNLWRAALLVLDLLDDPVRGRRRRRWGWGRLRGTARGFAQGGAKRAGKGVPSGAPRPA